jgi:hypothetical protein
MSSLGIVGLFALFGIAAPYSVPLLAQAIPDPSEATDAAVQSMCANSRATLDAGGSAEDSVLAVDRLSRCEVSGAPYVARLWGSLSEGSAVFTSLKRASRFVRDTRIMDTLQAVATRTTISTAVRCAALDVLTGYAQPDFALNPLPTDTSLHKSFSAFHLEGRSGAVPLAGNASTSVIRLLASLSNSDPDATVRTRARLLGDALAARMATDSALARINTNLITINYFCGNRFRITNANFAVIPVHYGMAGSSGAKLESRLPPRPAGSPYSEIYVDAPAKGTIEVFYNGQLLQSKANGNKICGR